MYGLSVREGAKAKAYIYYFDDVILLFENVQGGSKCLKITKFECTCFVDGPIAFIALTGKLGTVSQM